MTGQLRFATIPLEGHAETGAVGAGYAAWVNASWAGFHGKPATAEQLEQMLQSHLIDERVLTGVYDDSMPAALVDPLVPVATYASFAKTLNIGEQLLPAHLITMVTVCPTHRRRGILRTLMGTDLAAAQAAGFPVAALTATEATIYGRFGFGRVTESQTLNLDVRREVRFHGESHGSMVPVAPEKLADIAPALFAKFHATHRGSVGRQEAYLRNATGQWGQDGPSPELGLRAAVHCDPNGEVQGYVTYLFTEPGKGALTLKVRDLVAPTEEARREIFRFLAAHDLVECVSYPFAAANDPLGWALEDPARVSFTEREHSLWVRVLDVGAAFTARNYRGNGTFTLRVTDSLNLVAGNYSFSITEGAATIERIPQEHPSDLECDAAVLGPLLLGSCLLEDLIGAGVLTVHGPSGTQRLAELLDLPGVPHAINGF